MIQIDVYERKLSHEEIINRFKYKDTTIKESKIQQCILFDQLKRINNQLLISYLDYIEDDNYIIFIKEQYGQSLEDFVKKSHSQNISFSLKDIAKIIYQLFQAIDILEQKGILLQSLSSKHVLINESFDIKITNYASSLLFNSSELKYHNEIKYTPPEFIFFPNKRKINSSVIWSIGIMILELLLSNETYIALSSYYNAPEFINNYIQMFLDNRDTSLLNLKNTNTLSSNPNQSEILFNYLNGKLIRKELYDEDLINLIFNCLVVNCDKRKPVKELLNHSFLNKMNIQMKENDTKIVLLPIDSVYFIKSNQLNEKKIELPNYRDTYELLVRICKIDIIMLLKKIGVLNYRSKLISIPLYCSLDKNGNKEITEVYNNTFNIKNDTSGTLNFIGTYQINFPFEYLDDSSLSSFIKSNYILVPLDKIKKDIDNYMKIKYKIGSIIYHTKKSQKEDLLLEIKRNDFFIPNTYRMLAYAILLDVDYFNDREYTDFALSFNINKEEMSQITKDLIRSSELNILFTSSEYQIHFKKIFSSLIINNEDFFYVQGMDSILIAMTSICSSDINMTYSLFYGFIKKTLFHFYDLQTHLIKNLQFHHLIIKRLLAYYDPELFLFFQENKIFDIQYATNWLLSLFSRSFRNNNLFRLWDILLIKESNIIYIIIISILLMRKERIMKLSFDDIMIDLNNLDTIDTEVLVENTLNKYQFIPQSLILISYEFNQNLLNELKQNEFFQNRWWDFCDFYGNEIDINVPIILLEDVMKVYDKIIFVDIRPKEQWEKCRINKSLNYDINSYDKGLNCFKEIKKNSHNQSEKEKKIIVLIGNQISKYNEVVVVLLEANISIVTILKGGIDIVKADEYSLLYIKK